MIQFINTDKIFKCWEPKKKNKFLIDIPGIGNFLIKYVNFIFNKESKLEIEIYDCINPSPFKNIFNLCKFGHSHNCIFTIIGPVQDLAGIFRITIKNIVVKTKYTYSSDKIQSFKLTADIVDIEDIYYSEMKLTDDEKQKIISTLAPNLKNEKRDTQDLAKSQMKAINKKIGKK